MKLLLGTAALGIALLSFAGSENTSQTLSNDPATTTVYQDTIPKKDTSSKKDRKKDKKERRDTLSYR